MKKKDRVIKKVQQNNNLFKCPVCHEAIYMNDTGSFSCQKKHNFDLAKKGYINLLLSGNNEVYSKELFASRRVICDAGFYDPLIEKLVKIINSYNQDQGVTILDAGCGEGSHLTSIYTKLNKDNTTFVGVDIAKESINLAASNNTDIIWCVADLAKLPFQDQSINVILNILSPANYHEFNRVLNDKGIVIKVVPDANYLGEIRKLIYKGQVNENYSNEKVIVHFISNLNVKEIIKVNYDFPVNPVLLQHFLTMTPLTWGKPVDNLKGIDSITTITADFQIIIGEKK